MQNWALSLPQRVALLKLWVLPLFFFWCMWPKLFFQLDEVVDLLTFIYKTTLNLNSWGIAPDILAHSPEVGGYSLPPPPAKVFL